MMWKRFWLLGAVVAAACGSAAAHPHVFAEARLDVIVDDSARVSALRHLWRFDEAFSSSVVVDFDRDGDLQLGLEELDEIAGIIHESLADFDYFQFVTADGAAIAMEAPPRLVADFQDGQLIVLFESKPRSELKLAGKIAVGVYDPTFFTAIDYVDDAMMAVENLPGACSRAVVRPDPDEAIAANQENLTEAFFDPDDPADLGKIFATRLELTCPPA